MIKRVKTSKGDLPVNFGMYMLAQFSEHRGITMDEVISLNPAKLNLMDMSMFVYLGFVDGARKAGEECAFKSVEDLCDYADEHDDQLMGEALKVYYGEGKEAGESKKK